MINPSIWLKGILFGLHKGETELVRLHDVEDVEDDAEDEIIGEVSSRPVGVFVDSESGKSGVQRNLDVLCFLRHGDNRIVLESKYYKSH